MRNLKKSLIVAAMFIVSIYIGSNMMPTIVQATEPPPQLSPKEFSILKLPSVVQEKPPVENIEVLIDVANNNVTVNGAQNARVNVVTTNYPKEKIRYVTKYKTIKTGRPETKIMEDHIKSLLDTPEETFGKR